MVERSTTRTVSFKSVALPAEHGSWSLVSEPILLGLLVSPTLLGLAMAIAAFFFFLVNRPLKIFWTDWRRGRAYERTALARQYVIIYGTIAVAASVVTFIQLGWRPFAPFLLAGPLLLIFMYYDQRPGRFRQAELAAPAAFAAVVAAITLAGGMEWIPALGLWGFMIARSVPAVIFVRARLRLDKGKQAELGDGVLEAIIVHILALIGVTALAWQGWLPWSGLAAAVMLLARAIWGLSPYRWRSSVKALGFLETAFGTLSVLIVAIGFWLS